MPQRQKAKTKKQMKKSINGLYKALVNEKQKHVKATNLISILQMSLHDLAKDTAGLHGAYKEAKHQLKVARHNTEGTLNTAAELLKRAVK